MDKVKQLKNLKRIRKITKLMDTAIGIPGTKIRFGLEPILGLVPGGGDLVAGLISAYMIYLATSFGLEKSEIFKMIKNVAIDTAVGSVPVVGDIFDAFFKSNVRNLEILENHIAKAELSDKTVETPNLTPATS